MRLPQFELQAPLDCFLPGSGGVQGEEGVKLGPHLLLEAIVARLQGAWGHKGSNLGQNLAGSILIGVMSQLAYQGQNWVQCSKKPCCLLWQLPTVLCRPLPSLLSSTCDMHIGCMHCLK